MDNIKFRSAILTLLAVIAILLVVQCKPTPVHIINTVFVKRTVLVYVTPTISTLPFYSSIIPPPTATPQPLPTWTKTQATATPTATSTRTPLPGTPTPTNTPKPSRTRIPEILGFTDQVIEQLEQKEYHLVDQEKATTNGYDYVAYLFNAPVEYQDRVLLIYRMQESEPILLFDSGLGLYPVPIAINEWGDINSDGRPDLLIQYSTLGNGWCAYWYDSLQINPDGNLSDILPIRIHDIQDLNSDGVKELIFRDCRGEMYASAHVWGVASFRVYAWDDTMPGVRDVSAQFLAQYDESIEKRAKAVEESYAQYMNDVAVQNCMTEAFGLLLDYENSWRRDEGWQVYWSLTDPANWTKLDQAGYDVIAHLRGRHQEQYEVGETFR